MGIPSFFREILTKYKKTHFWDPEFVVQYLLLDYNAMIHNMVSQYFKEVSYDMFSNLSSSKKDEKIINFILSKTLDFVNNVAKPKKLLYISIDGPAPKSKMELQRFRRYRSIKAEAYLSQLRERYNIENDVSMLWDKSAMISPGTSFMKKLSETLWKAINEKKFGDITVILSDSSRPGEGEHKILPFIRSLKNPKSSIVIYSPDADLIVLALSYPGNIYILRPKDKNSQEEMTQYPENDYIYLSINEYRTAFLDKHKLKVDPIRFSRDLMFITFFGGNDFCRPIPFLKINKNGMETIANVYKNVFEKRKDYLVEIKKVNDKNIPLVNISFLNDIFVEFSKMEEFKMREEYERILKKIERKMDEPEDTYEAQKSTFEHSKFYESINPFAIPELFKVINYQLPKSQWKDQYYNYFFNISPDNPKEYRDFKKTICMEYLKGLEYTIQYYLSGLPSWKWHYPFRVAPMPSDILFALREAPQNLNFKFNLDTSYTPLQQLSMIIPPQSADALPKPMRSLLTSDKSPIIPFYPTDFTLDVVAGEKFIYSEPILPSMVDELILPFIDDAINSLTSNEKERDELKEDNMVYDPNDNMSNMAFKEPVPFDENKKNKN